MTRKELVDIYNKSKLLGDDNVQIFETYKIDDTKATPTKVKTGNLLVSVHDKELLLLVSDEVTKLTYEMIKHSLIFFASKTEKSFTISPSNNIYQLKLFKVVGGKGVKSADFGNIIAEVIDLSDFDFSNITSFDNMFKSVIAKRIIFNNPNTSNVKTMRNTFFSCHINDLDLSGFDTRSVTTMYQTFHSARINRLNLNGWNTSSVENMSRMFSRCTTNELDLSSFTGERLQDINEMFANATVRDNIDTSNLIVNCAASKERVFEHIQILDKEHITVGDSLIKLMVHKLKVENISTNYEQLKMYK